MSEIKVFESEYHFLKILGEEESISFGELVKKCSEKLDWKRTAAYTVIKRLSERGIVKNGNSIATFRVSQKGILEAKIR